MLNLKCNYIDDVDRVFLKKFAKYVCDKLDLTKEEVKRFRINLHIVKLEDLDEVEDRKRFRIARAWVFDQGIKNNKRTFNIYMKANRIRKAKTLQFKYKELMLDLAHELTHVKQYIRKEMYDYVDGSGTRFRGEYYAKPVKFSNLHHTSHDAYYNAPWEIEAFGREWGMWKRFHLHLKEEEAAKAKKRNGKEKTL